MPEMTESELIAVVSEAIDSAATFTDKLSRQADKNLSEYNGDLYGDEVEGQSTAVSTDVADVINSDMPSLARIFMGSGDIVTFQPNSENTADAEEAEQKTKYINWLVRSQPESFKILHDWLKGAGLQEVSVVKYFMESRKETEEIQYRNVSVDELESITNSLSAPDIEKVDVVKQEPNDDDTYNLTFRVTRTIEKLKIINIPPESFLISEEATCKSDASLIGDRVSKTRGELIADGYKRELVDSLPTITKDNTNSKSRRGVTTEETVDTWATQEVELCEVYVTVDFDGDDIPERRRIVMSGNHIIENEPFNHQPYALLSAMLMPHKIVGKSRASTVSATQKQKTSLLRGTLNNIWMVNNPRNVVHGDVDLDDMLTVRVNGIVRLEDGSEVLPQNAVFPLTTPYIGDKALQVIQYIDSARAQSTGSLMANQGLDADAVAKETATRFNGTRDDGQAKIELIARNFGETGFRDLYEGIAWTVSRFQNTEKEIMILGKQLAVDPTKWRCNHYVSTSVGLGAGNNEKLIESLQGIYAIQSQLKAQGSVLADDVDVYNTLKRIVDGLGLPRVDEFFNNPEEPGELLKAENELLNIKLMEAQNAIEQMQNPLKEAEEIKSKSFLVKAQSDAVLEIEKMKEDQRQFNVKMEAEAKKQAEAMAAKLTELELKYNSDVPGAVV